MPRREERPDTEGGSTRDQQDRDHSPCSRAHQADRESGPPRRSDRDDSRRGRRYLSDRGHESPDRHRDAGRGGRRGDRERSRSRSRQRGFYEAARRSLEPQSRRRRSNDTREHSTERQPRFNQDLNEDACQSSEPPTRDARSDAAKHVSEAQSGHRESSTTKRPRSSSRSVSKGRNGDVNESSNANEPSTVLAEAPKRKRVSKWDLTVGSAETKRASGESSTPTSLSSLLHDGTTSANNSFTGPAPGHLGPPRHTVDIDHKWVDYVLGKNGEAIQQIEISTGAVIRFEHHVGSTGYSICKIFGSEAVAQMGADMVRVRLANVSPDAVFPNGFIVDAIEVEHSVVGNVLGKNGELLRSMAERSGAIMTFERDKPGRMGVDELKIVGRQDQVKKAKSLVMQKIDEALTIRFGPDVFGEPEATVDVPVEQQFIGWIMGKSKETIKHIAESSGATIEVKQATKMEGHSIIRIMGARSSADHARQMIDKRVEQGKRYQDDKKAQFIAGDWLCKSCGDQQSRRIDICRRCGASRPTVDSDGNEIKSEAEFLRRECDDAFQVDQKYVGFIIGPGGQTLREIKETSGAKVYIDQNTRDHGYSIIRIGDKGTPENLLAKELIQKKMKECKSLQKKGLRPSGQVVPPPDAPINGVLPTAPTDVLPTGMHPSIPLGQPSGIQCKASPPQASIMPSVDIMNQYPNHPTPSPQPKSQAIFSIGSAVDGFHSSLQMHHAQMSPQPNSQPATSGSSWDSNSWASSMGNMLGDSAVNSNESGIMKPQQHGCGKGAAGVSIISSCGGIDGTGGGALMGAPMNAGTQGSSWNAGVNGMAVAGWNSWNTGAWNDSSWG